jgi:hypothetical protein
MISWENRCILFQIMLYRNFRRHGRVILAVHVTSKAWMPDFKQPKGQA